MAKKQLSRTLSTGVPSSILKEYGFDYDKHIRGYIKAIFSNNTRGEFGHLIIVGHLLYYKNTRIFEAVVSDKLYAEELYALAEQTLDLLTTEVRKWNNH